MALSSATVLLTVALAAMPTPRPGKYAAALVAADGARSTLYRYLPEGGGEGLPAILLLPDAGMTHRSFDLGGRGLARFLFENGLEVFVLEYRGTGRSQLPVGGYGLEGMRLDAEAALRRVLRERPRVALGGCGFGATLAFLLAGADPDHVSSVVGLQPVATLDLPNEPVAAALAHDVPAWVSLPDLSRTPLFGRTWFEVLLANDGAIGAEDARGLSRRVLAPVPGVLVQEIAGAMRARTLRIGGEDVQVGMARHRGRSLVLLAPRDNWIHPEFASPLLPLLDRQRTQVRVLSRVEGSRLDYGHLGMLLAEEAARDVDRPILRFLLGEEGPR